MINLILSSLSFHPTNEITTVSRNHKRSQEIRTISRIKYRNKVVLNCIIIKLFLSGECGIFLEFLGHIV